MVDQLRAVGRSAGHVVTKVFKQSHHHDASKNNGGNGVQPLALGSEWFAIDVSKSAVTQADLRIAAENKQLR
jgi:hypothetical protein